MVQIRFGGHMPLFTFPVQHACYACIIWPIQQTLSKFLATLIALSHTHHPKTSRGTSNHLYFSPDQDPQIQCHGSGQGLGMWVAASADSPLQMLLPYSHWSQSHSPRTVRICWSQISDPAADLWDLCQVPAGVRGLRMVLRFSSSARKANFAL